MSKFFALALVAALTAWAADHVLAAGTQNCQQTRTQTQTQTQQSLQAGTCQNSADCTCPNPDCPEYQYQCQTGDTHQWGGPEEQWWMYMFQFGPWW